VHPALAIALGHFLVEYSPARSHPLDVPRAHCALIAEAVGMMDGASEDIRDRLDAPVGVPRKAGKVVGWTLVPEIVEEEEGIKFSGISEAEGAAKFHPRSLNCRSGFYNALDRPD
jgi:hypothetical protein